METQNKPLYHLCCFFVFFFASFPGKNNLVHGSSHESHLHSTGNRIGFSKLFVFGDSYADTGNNRKGAGSWSIPYGTTFPGKPSGRYSDGRVFTDYLASYLRIRSPIPYRLRKYAPQSLRYGMNFAYGGTGVFDTYAVTEPNMTKQIDFLQRLIKEGVYTKHDLSSSMAHVSVAGNDYATYTGRNGTVEGIPAFITSVINQLTVDLSRIHAFGVRKITVTSLPPVGCLPGSTFPSSFKTCNETQNALVSFHNQLLQQAVTTLNNSTKDSTFVILDLDTAFLSAMKSQGNSSGKLKFTDPMKPCCLGISSQYSCGDTDKKGVKQYTICKDPDSTFFWDLLHPSQQGWLAVYSTMRDSLNRLYN